MSIKELLVTGWQSPNYPYKTYFPLWRIALMLLVAIPYYPARWYVDWAENL